MKAKNQQSVLFTVNYISCSQADAMIMKCICVRFQIINNCLQITEGESILGKKFMF